MPGRRGGGIADGWAGGAGEPRDGEPSWFQPVRIGTYWLTRSVSGQCYPALCRCKTYSSGWL